MGGFGGSPSGWVDGIGERLSGWVDGMGGFGVLLGGGAWMRSAAGGWFDRGLWSLWDCVVIRGVIGGAGGFDGWRFGICCARGGSQGGSNGGGRAWGDGRLLDLIEGRTGLGDFDDARCSIINACSVVSTVGGVQKSEGSGSSSLEI